MNWPEIRVTRSAGGINIKDVVWGDGEEFIDLTGMKVSNVETQIEQGLAPKVKVTFLARLVEVQEQD